MLNKDQQHQLKKFARYFIKSGGIYDKGESSNIFIFTMNGHRKCCYADNATFQTFKNTN